MKLVFAAVGFYISSKCANIAFWQMLASPNTCTLSLYVAPLINVAQ